MLLRTIFVAGAVLAVAGCDETVSINPFAGDTDELPLNPGYRISPSAGGGGPWSFAAGGGAAALVFTGTGGKELRVQPTRLAATSIRHTAAAPMEINALAFLGATEEVYFLEGALSAATSSLRYTHVESGDVFTLHQRAPGISLHGILPGSGSPIVASATGHLVAFIVAPDSLHVHDAATRSTRFIANGCSGIVALSPDDKVAVCRAGYAMTSVRLDIPDATPEAFAGMPQHVRQALLHLSWSGSGMKALFDSLTAGLPMQRLLRLYNSQTGSATTVGVLSSVGSTALSPDGTMAVFWARHCASPSALGCNRFQYVLLAHDVGVGITFRAAVADREPHSYLAIIFSPDGKYVYYRTREGELHEVPVR